MIRAAIRRAAGAAFALAAAAALLAPGPARADGVSCDAKLRATSEATAARGVALEREGKLVEAYAHYRSASEYCDVAAADEGIPRVGKKLGLAAERAGRVIGNDRLQNLAFFESKPGCLGKATPECVTEADLDVLRRASAIAWYEGTGNPGETDRVMLAHAKAHPTDLSAFRHAWGHFRAREQAGYGDPVKPGTPCATLQGIAKAQVTAQLAAEAKAFSQGSDESGSGSMRCLAHLGEARKWSEEALLDAAPVTARAVERGETRLRGASFVELAEADRFFEFAGREDRRAEVRKKAAAQGEKAQAAGDWMRASQYFTLAGDEQRAQAVMPKVDSISKPDPEKLRKQFEKSDAEKEKFRKEQEELEKELGL